MSTFANERIVITGAGSGLGRIMAKELIAAGALVLGVDRVIEPLTSLSEEVGAGSDRLFTATADVTDRAGVIARIRELEERAGPIDRLIACAGVGRATPADTFSSAEFEAIIQVNLLGVANSIEAVLPGMIARRRGHLVGLSSLASMRGLPQMSAYCASKAGLNSLFDALAIELRVHNIQVTTVCPGWIRTPMTAPLGDKFPFIMGAEPAARRILKAVRLRTRFTAFPFLPAILLRLLRILPPGVTERFLRRRQKTLYGNTSLNTESKE